MDAATMVVACPKMTAETELTTMVLIWKPERPAVAFLDELIKLMKVEADVCALPSFSVYSIMRGIFEHQSC